MWLGSITYSLNFASGIETQQVYRALTCIYHATVKFGIDAGDSQALSKFLQTSMACINNIHYYMNHCIYA